MSLGVAQHYRFKKAIPLAEISGVEKDVVEVAEMEQM